MKTLMIVVSILLTGCVAKSAEDRTKAEAYCSKYQLETISLSSPAVPIGASSDFACRKKGEDDYQIVPQQVYNK